MKGYIYCIRSHQTDQIYIGSTTQILSKRMSDHRVDYKCWLNKKRGYVTSFEILKFDNAYIELLQEVEVESKAELRKLEGENIRKHNCVNKRIEGRTIQEWTQDNAVKIAEYRTIYKKNNRVQISEHQTIYRQKNAIKIKEKKAKPYTCECGSIITTAGKAQHCRTNKHLKYIFTLNGTESRRRMAYISGCI